MPTQSPPDGRQRFYLPTLAADAQNEADFRIRTLDISIIQAAVF